MHRTFSESFDKGKEWIMKPTIRFIILFLIAILAASACSSPSPTATQAPLISSTETAASTATATTEPSPVPTQSVLDLEILEWSEWPYTDLSDPSKTDTHVEVLFRNPNDFPVRVNNDEDELRFVNAAGEVVYTNTASVLYIWQGEWMLPGETAALSACVCFDTQGLEKQKWESLELFAPLEIATDIFYTQEVEVKLGQIVDIAAAHLGGSGFALETTFTNTSDQALESVPHRVLARDASGRYIGVAFAGNAVVSFTENIAIQPGDTATGLNVIEINYVDESSLPMLTYEVAAIGIPYQAAPEVVLPAGTPLADWNGIPIMPGAIGGEAADGGYQYTTAAELDAISSFYEAELSKLGFVVTLTVDEAAGYAILEFQKDGTSGIVAIAPLGGGLHGVAISINP
jgi:hypothetical protein